MGYGDSHFRVPAPPPLNPKRGNRKGERGNRKKLGQLQENMKKLTDPLILMENRDPSQRPTARGVETPPQILPYKDHLRLTTKANETCGDPNQKLYSKKSTLSRH
ncbi:hypothetical protein HGM15179_014752 [Zosterops borbonicus]|uniref:Uncharacterized protein n=1 Tax=Zosterops borbonicus TaxID=364589 RepID=A0A8K1LFV7_9PASS|nr:hypothetical protein HGM15179_014752 [Zosterops borbonicus]